MSGGWAGSDRRSRLPTDWPTRVAAVRRRSGGRCEFLVPGTVIPRRCPNVADGGVDHIIPNDDDSLDNLRDSCSRHHREKSSREGNEAKEAIRSKRTRPPERHPGTIAPWAS